MCVHKFSVKVNLNICMRVWECTRMATKQNKTLVEWLELKDVGERNVNSVVWDTRSITTGETILVKFSSQYCSTKQL